MARPLALVIDLANLTAAVQNVHADDAEQELLARIEEQVKGKLARNIWSVLARLGKVRKWTVNGKAG